MEAASNPAEGTPSPESVAALAPQVVKKLLLEAVFWRDKYFELQHHTSQVISMLRQPVSVPGQAVTMLGTQPVPAAEPQQPDNAEEWRPKLV